MLNTEFVNSYLEDTTGIILQLSRGQISLAVELLVQTRNRGGRLFILGVGGSAANASHAVNDFRKMVGLETYTPVDNVAELTARTNDNGWSTVFVDWLTTSHINKKDTVLVLSVGGGGILSPNIKEALDLAKLQGAHIIGIVSRDGGYTATIADCLIHIPVVSDYITPHAEEFQSIILHLIVNHPRFSVNQTKAVFLDRDGVLCQDGSPKPLEVVLQSGTELLSTLRMRGFLLIVVTNQAGVPRGYITKQEVQDVNNILMQYLPLDDILVCYHDTNDNCQCRKPKPGMLWYAAHMYNIDLSKSFMIGDRDTDVMAGLGAGCYGIKIDETLTLAKAIEFIGEKDENSI